MVRMDKQVHLRVHFMPPLLLIATCLSLVDAKVEKGFERYIISSRQDYFVFVLVKT